MWGCSCGVGLLERDPLSPVSWGKQAPGQSMGKKDPSGPTILLSPRGGIKVQAAQVPHSQHGKPERGIWMGVELPRAAEGSLESSPSAGLSTSGVKLGKPRGKQKYPRGIGWAIPGTHTRLAHEPSHSTAEGVLRKGLLL